METLDSGKDPYRTQSLHEQLGPRRFVQHLEKEGLTVTDEVQGDEQRLTLAIPAGEYHVAFGFPRIREDDTRYFYGNLPPELQERALVLDTESPEFQGVVAEVEDMVRGRENDTAYLVDQLQHYLNQRFETHMEDEDVHSLSEIVQSGRTVCAGLALIAGLTLQKIRPDLDVSLVTGSPLQFDETKSITISHQWLRIRDGAQVELFDPYFNEARSYDLSDPRTDDTDPFARYRVFAFGVGGMIRDSDDTKLSNNVQFVEIPDGNELWVTREESLAVQIKGKLAFIAERTEGTITTVDGSFEVSRNPAVRTSARYLIPILGFERA